MMPYMSFKKNLIIAIIYLSFMSPRLCFSVRSSFQDETNENDNQKNCALSKYECCPDGVTPAKGPDFKGCKEETSLLKLNQHSATDTSVCSLPEPITTCDNYTIQWRYDVQEGRCVQFWYGGCDGNANRFNTVEECEGRCVKPNGTDICKLPLSNPNNQCQYNLTRYYYDINSFTCKKFIYSGCLGNNNNFETLDECERRCQVPLLYEQCLFIPDKGPCRGNYERWFFDSKVGMCKTFGYGGCIKNKNNHLSEDDCIDSCVKPKQKAVCLLPKITGNCDQKINSWYYDFKEGSCKLFTYSGCNGNLNRFETLEACQYTCQGLNSVSDKKALYEEEVCDVPKSSGYCHLNLQRWYFNKTTMMCHQFTYSGCDGNSNNFESELDCRNTCNAKEADPCVLSVDHGTCDNYKIFWYFNQVDKECVRFYYGGCDGNQNRFESKENCEFSCKFTKEEKQALLKLPKQCIMAVDAGSGCQDSSIKFYFDTQNKVCYPFDYTGCGPEVSNRFESEDECSKLCNENFKKETLNVTAEAVSEEQKQLEKIEFDICELDMKAGNCSQKVTKWFYDKKAKYCRQFEFTGCNGNENRFETRQQCTEICEYVKRREICNSNKIQGPCVEFQSRWYHDTETRSCQEFKYGGCLGNENNFETKMECKSFCWDYLSEEAKYSSENTESTNQVPTTSPDTNENTKMNCMLPRDEGNSCGKNATFEKWYFDTSISACQKFVFQGCGGNLNRFDTRAQCENKCNPNSAFMLDTSSFSNNQCEAQVDFKSECINEQTSEILLSRLTGPDLIWFYDIEARSCKQIDKSCLVDSNQNYFDTFNSCKSQCIPNVDDNPIQDDCLLPVESGNKCSFQIWRWYYDLETGSCLQFSYSGCLGNNNNFATRKKCLKLCASVGKTECPPLDDCAETCKYGRAKSLSGCELCECNNPCEEFKCTLDEDCAVENSKAVCRPKIKPGMCPHLSNIENSACNSTCSSDSDCYSDEKCCPNQCNSKHCTPPNLDVDPIIEEFIDRMEFMEGDKLVLPCKVSGYPMPTVTWFKNRHELTFTGTEKKMITNENNSLIIFNLTDKDEAIYSCRASNSKGKAVVKESTVFAELSVRNYSYEIYELFGVDVLLHCNLPDRIYPRFNDKFSWRTEKFQIKSNPLKYSINSNILIIKRLDYSDIGKYICTVTNKDEKILTVNVTLKRAVPGEVTFNAYETAAESGTTIVLNCSHTGTPKPSVVWYTPTNQIITNETNQAKFKILPSSQLEISSLKQTDTGIYKCLATNKFSFSYMRKKYGYINLNVYSKPVILSKSEKFNLISPSNIILNCVTTGYPVPKINWFHNYFDILFKNKSKYSILPNGSLELYDLNRLDSGIYSCHASSLDKYPTAKIVYTINVTEPNLNHQLEIILINEGQNAVLKCRTISGGQENIWKFSDESPNFEFIQNNSILKINSIRQKQSGSYECLSVVNNESYLKTYNLVVGAQDDPNKIVHLVKAVQSSSVILNCSSWFDEKFNNKKIKYIVQWKLNNKDLLVDDLKHEFVNRHKTILKVNHLTINETNDEYVCLFDSNLISNYKLFVGALPNIKDKAYTKPSNSIKWLDKYSNYTLECPLQVGIPKPEIKWYFNFQPIVNLTNHAIHNYILKINNFDENLHGTYICNSTNEFGYEIYKYRLYLAVPLQAIQPETNRIIAKKTDNVIFACKHNDARPRPLIKWTFNDSTIKKADKKYTIEKNTLLVKNISSRDEGIYRCLLSNNYHLDQNISYTLQIHEPVVITFIPESPLFKIGSDAKITCQVDNPSRVNQVAWFKNGLKLQTNDKFSVNSSLLTIHSINSNDAGKYVCKLNVGQSFVTKSLTVKVIENDVEINCEDTSSYADCKLVLTKSLCSKWGKFCCRTCRLAGFEVNLDNN